MNRIEGNLSEEGVPIPVRATFISLKFMPSLFAIGHNNLNPELTLFGEHLEIKSVKSYRIEYDDIREASVLKTFATRNVRLKLRRGLIAHTANVRDDESLNATLEFLSGKGLKLNGKARKYLTRSNT